MYYYHFRSVRLVGIRISISVFLKAGVLRAVKSLHLILLSHLRTLASQGDFYLCHSIWPRGTLFCMVRCTCVYIHTEKM